MAARHNSVEIVEICKVAPPPSTSHMPGYYSSSPKSLPLTFFDILWLRLPPVERLFYYQLPTDPNMTSFFDHILPKLKHSLSLTLQHYLPLAGTITWPHHSHKPIISFTETDAVSLTVAQSVESDLFTHLSDINFYEAAMHDPLVPQLIATDVQAQVMSLQITLFPNTGFSIGISTHHAALDGKSSTTFMKSWAHICKSSSPTLPSELNPFYDRSVITDPLGLEEIYTNVWLNHNGPNNKSLMFLQLKVPPGSVRATFELTRENIEKLKKIFDRREKVPEKPVHVTTFSITVAYVLACLAKAEEIKHSKIVLAMAIDGRTRLKPQVPKTYTGNCVGGRFAIAETRELVGENGIVVGVEAISEALRGLDDDDGLLSEAEQMASMISSLGSYDDHTRVIGIAGSPMFQVYSTDFGWGKPVKVDVTSIDKTGAFSISESRNGGGGVEIGLVRDRSEVEAYASLFVQGLEAL